jgi:ribonuclease D
MRICRSLSLKLYHVMKALLRERHRSKTRGDCLTISLTSKEELRREKQYRRGKMFEQQQPKEKSQ